ncbi:hypothetical protein CN997_26185 [Bacillus cereus]|nr:hypothetical protein CN997_26185 [Bacillus cereus]
MESLDMNINKENVHIFLSRKYIYQFLYFNVINITLCLIIGAIYVVEYKFFKGTYFQDYDITGIKRIELRQ